MEEFVKELRKIVSVKASHADDYLSMNSKYVPILLDSKNFHSISDVSDLKNRKILFVDGGNSILFESAGFCAGFIRVGGVVYSNNKRVSRDQKEFYVLVQEKNSKYFVQTSPKTSFDGLIFDPEDESLKSGIEKCGVTKIISVIRRFAELEYAYNSNNNSKIDNVILDGTLEARYPYEDKYLDKLFSKKNVCALSKTCTLTTKHGQGILKVLSDIAALDVHFSISEWFYYPAVTSNNPLHVADVYFVKLNAFSKHAFRFEVQREFSGNISELLSMLAANSRDPIFLGYPYGLIDVDQYVRVSEEESRMLQTKISMMLGKEWNEFSKNLNSTNAHSILDKIKF
jgi:hypothetical protein